MRRIAAPLTLVLAAGFGGVVMLAAGCAHVEPERAHASVATESCELQDESEPIRPIPPRVELDAREVALGAALFHDPRLSRDDSVSCATCHPIALGGADRRARSLGVGGAVGGINTPTVLNSGFWLAQFWDGRAPTLEAQVDGPTQHPAEMASSWPEILEKLGRDDALVAKFGVVYPDGLSADNVRKAIAVFERSLVTPNSKLDRWLCGDTTALSQREKHGYALFKAYGCISCHHGVGVGGNMFQRFGVARDYFADRELTDADLGRYAVTGDPNDRHVFKVPSLRNVALTAPYFHDGSAATLSDAVTVMGRYQLGRKLGDADVESLVAFLGTLTGDLPGATP
ncbi:MAG: cytochrome-c peroxidase [Myxococcota bacterium]